MAENLPTKNKVIGTSLNNLNELVIQYADQGTNILLLGPRGTGKELFAKLYQERTGRKRLIPINCSGIGDSNLISELFGHKKESFTDAKADRAGLLSTYGKNQVIFLDEIGDASPSFQAALLRLLQTGDYKPFGSDEVKKLDPDEMRIIAATTKTDNVRPELKDRFTTLHIPGLALRMTKGDFPELIRAFCKDTEVKFISQEALKRLEAHSWPGNIRELKKVLEDAILLCKIAKRKKIQIDDLATLKQSFESHTDNSKGMKISELPSNSESPPHWVFYQQAVLYKEKPFTGMKTEEAEMLRTRLNSIDSSISRGFRGIQGAISSFSNSELKKPSTKKINFENTLPDEYKILFWEHYAKIGTGAAQIERQFEGRIKSKTAWGQLKKAKERLDGK
jgi:DNA-binding NtrC family response regulator